MRAFIIAIFACLILSSCVRDPYYYDDGPYYNRSVNRTRTVNRNVNRNVNRTHHIHHHHGHHHGHR